jgi:hypothetical protein
MGMFTLGSEARRMGRMQQLRDSFRGLQHDPVVTAEPEAVPEMAAPVKEPTQIIALIPSTPLVENG